MQEFIRAIGLPTTTVEIPLARCLHLPQPQTLPPRVAHTLAHEVQQPVVYQAGESYTVFVGAPLLATAQAGGIAKMTCTVLSAPLAPGILEFLRAVGQMYIGATLHVVLLAQTVWGVYFWTNAQALYKEAAQNETPILPPLDVLNASGEQDGQQTFAVATVEDLCGQIEQYMATFFLPSHDYKTTPKQVLVSWEEALAPFPHAPSETKRKALMRLYYAIPASLRAEFRQLHVPVKGLHWLAGLPEGTVRQVLAELRAVPVAQHREVLARISRPGGWRQPAPPPEDSIFPPDALLAEANAQAGATGRTVYQAVRHLHQASQLLQSLPTAAVLSVAQASGLLRSSDQLWDLLEPLLSRQPSRPNGNDPTGGEEDMV